MTLDIMLLEERIVLDGAAVDTVVDQIVDMQAANEAQAPSEPVDTGAHDANPAEAASDVQDAGATAGQDAARSEVVVIDSAVENKQAILDSVSDDMTVIVLESGQGLSDVGDMLAGMTDIDALHIISHGESNQITLGGEVISSGNLDNYADELTSWQDVFSADADILLYGCNVADSTEADIFLDRIAALTGTDISASDDPTGAESLGGDWTLEVKSGPVETDEIVVADYTGTLGALNMDGTDTTLTAFKGQSTVVDSGLTISYPDGSPITNARVIISGYQSGDTLSASSINGITSSFDSGKGVLNLTGTASAAQWQEVLRTVSFATTSNNLVTNRDVTFTLGNMISMEVNGKTHYYELVESSTNLAAALSDAESRNYFGLHGYLATITSAEENSLLAKMFSQMAWIAATDDPNQGVGASEGNFYWFSGPESGEQFWAGGVNGAAVNSRYQDWHTGEPNNLPGENHAVFCGEGSGFTPGWYDVSGATHSAQYIVEYGGMGTDPVVTLSHARTIDVIANTAPTTGTNTGLTVQEDASATTIAAANLTTTDNEHGASEVTYTVTDAPDKGTLKLNGVDLGQNSTFTQADIANNRLSFTPTANAEGSDSFSFTVADSLGASSGPTTFNLSITPVNDQLEATHLTQNKIYIEDAASVALDDIFVSDPDTAEQITATLTLADTAAGSLTANDGASYTAGTGVWTITGTVTQVNAALAGVAFTPAANYDADTTIAVNIKDGLEGGTTVKTGTITLDCTPVNDKPVITAGNTVNYSENDNATRICPAITLTDDSSGLQSVTVTVSNLVGGEDTVDWDHSLETNISASQQVDNQAGTATITFTSRDNSNLASAAEFQAILRSITYVNSSDTPTTNARTVAYTATDAEGLVADQATTTINVAAVNDVPEATNPGDAKSYTEGGQAVVVSSTLTLADKDNTILTGAKVSISNNGEAGDTLSYSDPTSKIEASYSTANGGYVLTLTTKVGQQATIADYQEALRKVTYSYTGQNSSANVRTIEFLGITDSDGGAGPQGTVSVNINVTTINNAPVLDDSGSPTLSAIDHLTLSPAGNTVASLLTDGQTDFATDLDSSNLGIAVTGVNDTGGKWQYSTDNGATWTVFGTVSDTSAVLLEATAKVRFLATPGQYGTQQITFRAWDRTSGSNGDSGVDVSTNGGTSAFSTASDTAGVTVSTNNGTINDPVLAETAVSEYTEEGAAVAVNPNLTLSDPDSNNLEEAAVYLGDVKSGDALNFEDQNGISGSYDAVTGVLSLSGTASVADYQAALRSVTFSSSSNNAASLGSTRTVSFIVTDGTNDSNALQSTVNVNTKPVPAQPGSSEGGEDSTSGNTEPIPDQIRNASSGDNTPATEGDSADSGDSGNSGGEFGDYGPEGGSEISMDSALGGSGAEGQGLVGGPGGADADLGQVINALGGGGLIDSNSGPGSPDADLTQVVRALQMAPSSLGGGFGGQADPLSINTGLPVATAEASSGPAAASPSGGEAAQASGSNTADGTPQQGGAGFDQDGRTSGSTGQQSLQDNIRILSVAVEGLRFDSQQAEFTVASLEKAVNQLSEIARTGQVREPGAVNEVSDMAAELTEICVQCARNGEDVGELLEKLDKIKQTLAN
ncbi:DUF4347 domain-containing protein [Maridesulfovibrio sp.]|uniref:DUF4347 domain-containing protein n=1 Tax=Maridesulfovibrio sp. TaxID=2795000 RepID=UPI002A18C840|nr:DUF4347 domain-containing protein [Maridesulfovibrio sp.]